MSFLVENHLSRRTIGLKYADENEDQHSNLNSKQCLHKTKNEYIKETIQQQEKEHQEELELFEEKQCRICLSILEDDELLEFQDASVSEPSILQPCQCKGSMSLVHRECLNTWLKQSPKRCDLCSTPYQYEWVNILPIRATLIAYVEQQKLLHRSTTLNYFKHLASHIVGGYCKDGVFACEHYHCLFARWPLTFALVLACVNVVLMFAKQYTSSSISSLETSPVNALASICVVLYAFQQSFMQLWDVLRPEPYYIVHHFTPNQSKTKLWLKQQAQLSGLFVVSLIASLLWLALVTRVIGDTHIAWLLLASLSSVFVLGECAQQIFTHATQFQAHRRSKSKYVLVSYNESKQTTQQQQQ